MRLVCISDTHGDHEKVTLPSGDLLIHAGDVTGHGTEAETRGFFDWFKSQPFEYKICIAGNHDTFMEQEPEMSRQMADDAGVILLNDSGVDINGFSFWGSPITPRFMDWAFMADAGADIETHWNQIPTNTDVLVTHGPPYGILDEVVREGMEKEHVGCPSLLSRIALVKPQIHVFGHIHEGHGSELINGVLYRNVSTMNRHYQIANDVQVIDLN